MHELALADAIVQICREHARGRRVTRVEVKIGFLRQVVPDSLAFAFELVASGTEVDGAQLAVEQIPARVACNTCGAETTIEWFPLACAHCGGLDVELIAGEECQVEALELEEKEEEESVAV
ncbi:MAG TPA: hydrogenase maturation nickel metallochaperone HypA [Gaiellaceae bacterium]|nr:hydrogenase maturation nickel metallochaperone HypA [Gaiellaceae bacterium]